MKYFFLILTTLTIFTGCISKKSYLLINTDVKKVTNKYKKTIGIQSIKLPQYLLGKEIPYLVKNSEIEYLDNSLWGSYLDEHLTNRVVNTLQLALNSPKVYQYPQNSPIKPEIIILITIHKFIADSKNVEFEASWEKNGQSQRYSTSTPIKKENGIIKSMNESFTKFELKLIEDLTSKI